jgi:hypothetical protein
LSIVRPVIFIGSFQWDKPFSLPESIVHGFFLGQLCTQHVILCASSRNILILCFGILCFGNRRIENMLLDDLRSKNSHQRSEEVCRRRNDTIDRQAWSEQQPCIVTEFQEPEIQGLRRWR